MIQYIRTILQTIKSLSTGIKLSGKHLFSAHERRNANFVDEEDYFLQENGRVTLNYPEEKLQVPEIGRYKLHNEIDDCIVCDKCAKICPVDCIEIDSIKSPEVIGYTSDDTPKRLYAAKFEIDMGKCCFCGLCTTVCPTECLTMTEDYDFSVFDIAEHKFEFSEMSEKEIEEKRKLAEENKKSKPVSTSKTASVSPVKKTFKPKFIPRIKKPGNDNKD